MATFSHAFSFVSDWGQIEGFQNKSRSVIENNNFGTIEEANGLFPFPAVCLGQVDISASGLSLIR